MPSLCIKFAFYSCFFKCAKEENTKKKIKGTFWRLISQEWLAQLNSTSDLVCVLSWYASTCTVNLVWFQREITEKWMRIKSYFVLHVNNAHVVHVRTFSWCPDTLPCIFTLYCVVVVSFKATILKYYHSIIEIQSPHYCIAYLPNARPIITCKSYVHFTVVM